MPRKASTKYIAIYMNDEAIEAVKAISEQKGYKSVGEYVRDLIKKDVEQTGQLINFGLDAWGGPGRRPQDQ